MSMTWLRRLREPRTEPVDHRQLQYTLTHIHIGMGVLWIVLLSLLKWGVGVSNLLLLQAAIVMVAIWLLPFAITLTAELHKVYWIARVYLGDADDRLLPKTAPVDER
jgi:hypothetical protein